MDGLASFLGRTAAMGTDPLLILLCLTVASMSTVGRWPWLSLPLAALPIALLIEWIIAADGYRAYLGLDYRFGSRLVERWTAALVLVAWYRALLVGLGALLRRFGRA
jgi:hypothetical protein